MTDPALGIIIYFDFFFAAERPCFFGSSDGGAACCEPLGLISFMSWLAPFRESRVVICIRPRCYPAAGRLAVA